MKTITPERLQELREQGADVDLIDVRTPVEFRSVHADAARNVPLDKLDPKAVIDERNGDAEKPLYVICQGGNRSAIACKRFADAGYEQIVDVAGGVNAWNEAGLPGVRGKTAVSRERQVRIAAGFLVFTGVSLGFAVHWSFYLLSGFVGAGLMFAGITDTCAMGMLIAKMPWNQTSTSCEVASK